MITHPTLEKLPCFATIILRYVVVKGSYIKSFLPTVIYFIRRFCENHVSNLLPEL